MALVERDEFMTSLQAHFENVVGGEVHCILLSGEAGIGKTALVKAFCKNRNGCWQAYFVTSPTQGYSIHLIALNSFFNE